MSKAKRAWVGGVVLAAALVLAACHKSEAPKQPTVAAQTATPELAVTHAISTLKAGDFDRLMQQALPPPAYQAMRAQWEAQRKQDLAGISAVDRKRFATEMAGLTAPDAKQTLMAQVQPLLDDYASKYKQRVPMIVGVGRIMAETRITRAKDMSAEQKSQARGVLDALADWAQSTDWGDQAKAEQAVGIVVDTARALDLKSLDAAYGLDYEQAMARYETAWKGLKQLLAVYGLPLDTILDSASVKTVSEQDDRAQVEVTFQVLGKPITSTVDMRREGKRWYAADALEKWHQRQAALAAAASVAAASSAPASAASAALAEPGQP